MFHVVLFEPEIPPNTGNIIRLCANTGADLHLIRPLGFDLDDSKLRRAGLDYIEWARVRAYPNLSMFLEQVHPRRLFACSTKGKKLYSDISFLKEDALLFGPETRGLPSNLLKSMDADWLLRIPMTSPSRSLNLSNAVAVILYEAWRQNNFIGATI